MKRKDIFLFWGIFSFFMAGCYLCPPKYEYMRAGVPSWIYKLPQKKGWVYAWGSAGQSISLEETKKYALENSRKTLATCLGVEVTHKTKKIELFAPSIYTKLKPIANWKTLKYEIVDEWLDEDGRAGLGYQYFVLVRTREP